MENSIYELHTNYYITVVLCHKSHVDFSIIIEPVRLAAKCVDTKKQRKKIDHRQQGIHSLGKLKEQVHSSAHAR